MQNSSQKLDVDEMLALDPLAESTRYSHFGFLTDLSANQVGNLLNDEHPKTIATVLSMLPPDFASDVLAALDPVIRVSALKRVCDDRTATTHELDSLHVALRRRVARLTATPASERELQFEDLTYLTDRQWQVLLRYTNTACWAPALKTAPRGLRERVLNNLALEPRRLLRREIDELLDLTNEQIDQARAAVLETCKTLCQGGKLDVRPY
ncbi:MAG TPA: FliG C-terminal domain-containing protein [Pirellulaceae bacterium]|nr:FliG C-terminal domain-containing protein [Pirellulaceae bacterium]